MVKFEVPFIEGLKELECAKYARLLTEKLSGVKYSRGHAWEMGDRNIVVANLDGDLENFVGVMEPERSIIIFYYKDSDFNGPGRIGTHAGVYLGYDEDIFIAHQCDLKQEVIPYRKMVEDGFSARQILAPGNLVLRS